VAHDPARSDPALPDLVERRFEAAGPDELWVADFTYLRSWHGVVFLSFVIDVWSRRVVGWQFSSNMRTSLVLDALRMALSGRRSGADVELVHHPDIQRERAATHHQALRALATGSSEPSTAASGTTPHDETVAWPTRSRLPVDRYEPWDVYAGSFSGSARLRFELCARQ
jgi:transposase InsO family protein